MKKILSALLLAAAVVTACSKDDAGSGEATAVKGSSSTVIGWGIDGPINSGSAFMYKTGQTYCFLLCEGEANSWEDAKKHPFLEIHIWEAYINTDISAVADLSRVYDINETPSHIYVCWSPGNGNRYFNKPQYASAQGNYTFESGSLSVSFLYGMYTIAFSGFCSDDKNTYSPGWSYAGQFVGMKTL